ncbi:hypothetical protein FCJ59_36840 [Cupriavidus basilensis]|nr:hypothetical protein [Cupriavidus basilensis]NUA32222.1 hypothetical protein [Cupriavidus basilensis]
MNTLALMRLRHFWAPLACGIALSGCAPMIATTPSAVELAQDGTTARSITIQTPVVIQLDTGYSRTLPAESVWKPVGRVPQGAVYRPVGTIFTVEGRQVHEAYLVLKDRKLVGFYLPGEQNYSPLSTAVPLTFGESE